MILDAPEPRRIVILRYPFFFLAAFFAAAIVAPAHADDAGAVPLSNAITGGVFDYTIAQGDTFTRVGSRFGVGPSVLAHENGKSVGDKLVVGKSIHVDDRHIIPVAIPYGIIINVPQRMLFYFQNDAIFGAYPVAVGRATRKWQTPLGKFTVVQVREHPTWHIPDSIQKERVAEGKDDDDEIEPGPDNPLGDYWIGLSLPNVGVHSTNNPISVYSFRTHGCVRLHPDDAHTLFNAARYGMEGEIVYVPLMMARLDDGRVFVESSRDVYRRHSGGVAELRTLAETNHFSNDVDWTRVTEVLSAVEGVAREVDHR